MKNALRFAFPPAFAALNGLLHRTLFPPVAGGVGDAAAGLVVAAALAWSAMIFIRSPQLRWAKAGWAALGVVGAFALAEAARVPAGERFWLRAMAGLVLFGVAGIQLYLTILRRDKAA